MRGALSGAILPGRQSEGPLSGRRLASMGTSIRDQKGMLAMWDLDLGPLNCFMSFLGGGYLWKVVPAVFH